MSFVTELKRRNVIRNRAVDPTPPEQEYSP